MKAKLTIKGSRVQDVGYRLYLLSKAKELRGFEAFNLGEDLVVLIEGEEEAVKKFIDVAKKERPPSAEVSDVLVSEYDGHVMDKGEFRSQFGLEQLTKIAIVGVEMRDDIKEMKGDIKTMLKKQDETISEVRKVGEEVKLTRKEIKQVGEEVRLTRDELRGEIKELRLDLRSYMDERLKRLEEDVRMIKARMGLE